MTKVKLDAAFCAAASCPEGRKKETYWDTIIQGFVLEVRTSGGKTYALRFFDETNRQRQLKIAGYGDVTFDQARKKARRLRAEVSLGDNPAEKKKEKRSISTYKTLAEQHIAHAKTYQKRPENTEAMINRHLLPRWGKLRLDEIKQQDVAKWLAEKRDEGLAPATVEKIRVMLSRSFELALSWNFLGIQRNPVKSIPRTKYSNARERFLTADEAARLRKAVEDSLNTQLKHIVGLLLLTGARVSELLHAEWRHIDKERRAWFIPVSKTGKSRHVPLSEAAMAIVEGLPKFDKCPYLVPNPETKQPFVSIKHAWQTARKAAGLPDLRIHDLRHSAASFMINAGVDLFAVGKVLGHADHSSTMRYAHLANDTLMRAVEAGATKMSVNWAGAPSLKLENTLRSA